VGETSSRIQCVRGKAACKNSKEKETYYFGVRKKPLTESLKGSKEGGTESNILEHIKSGGEGGGRPGGLWVGGRRRQRRRIRDARRAKLLSSTSFIFIRRDDPGLGWKKGTRAEGTIRGENLLGKKGKVRREGSWGEE